MSRKSLIGLIAALIILIGIFNAAFIVDQTEQVLVLRLSAINRTVRDPGLHFKIPLIERVETFDKRVLELDAPSQRRLLNDKKWLLIDSYVLYRIVDPAQFYVSVHSETVLKVQLGNLVNSAMQNVLSDRTVAQVLSADRPAIYTQVKQEMVGQAERLGVEIVDVRIRRAEFPPENSQSIYARMRSERKQEAAKYRGEGDQISAEKKAKADRDRTVILAEAQRDSAIARGEGDRQALDIINEASSRDTRFYLYYRTLQAYKDALRKEDTTLVLSPQSQFMRDFEAVPKAGAGD
jgi:membrane protease subunit HflC